MTPGKERGMSLVEVLVAVAVAAIVMTPMLQMSAQMVKNYRKLRATVDMVQNASFAFSRMAKEVSAAYWHGPLTLSGNLPSLVIDADPTYSTSDRLSWNATTYNTYEDQSDPEGIDMVELQLARAFHTGQTMYYLRLRKDAQDVLDEVPDASVTAGTAADIGDAVAFNVEEVSFQALTGATLPLTKAATYTYTATGSNTLPKAVRVTLRLYDPGGDAADLVISSDISMAR